MFVVTLPRIGWKSARKNALSFVAAYSQIVKCVYNDEGEEQTTIRRPSATSPRSLAAFTRERALVVSSRLSKF